MRLMSFSHYRESEDKLFSKLEVIKFSDMVHMQNILLLKNLSTNKMPESIQNTYTVDLARDNDFNDFFTIPEVRTAHFGKYSIRYNCLLSWNEIQSLLMPTKLDDFLNLKIGLKKCFIATY